MLGPDDHREAIASTDPGVRRRLGSVGRPLPTVEVEIRDAGGAGASAGGNGGYGGNGGAGSNGGFGNGGPGGVAFETPAVLAAAGPNGAPSVAIDPANDRAVAAWQTMVGALPTVAYAVRGGP